MMRLDSRTVNNNSILRSTNSIIISSRFTASKTTFTVSRGNKFRCFPGPANAAGSGFLDPVVFVANFFSAVIDFMVAFLVVNEAVLGKEFCSWEQKVL
jgi:hypothetical protein